MQQALALVLAQSSAPPPQPSYASEEARKWPSDRDHLRELTPPRQQYDSYHIPAPPQVSNVAPPQSMKPLPMPNQAQESEVGDRNHKEQHAFFMDQQQSQSQSSDQRKQPSEMTTRQSGGDMYQQRTGENQLQNPQQRLESDSLDRFQHDKAKADAQKPMQPAQKQFLPPPLSNLPVSYSNPPAATRDKPLPFVPPVRPPASAHPVSDHMSLFYTDHRQSSTNFVNIASASTASNPSTTSSSSSTVPNISLSGVATGWITTNTATTTTPVVEMGSDDKRRFESMNQPQNSIHDTGNRLNSWRGSFSNSENVQREKTEAISVLQSSISPEQPPAPPQTHDRGSKELKSEDQERGKLDDDMTVNSNAGSSSSVTSDNMPNINKIVDRSGSVSNTFDVEGSEVARNTREYVTDSMGKESCKTMSDININIRLESSESATSAAAESPATSDSALLLLSDVSVAAAAKEQLHDTSQRLQTTN